MDKVIVREQDPSCFWNGVIKIIYRVVALFTTVIISYLRLLEPAFRFKVVAMTEAKGPAVDIVIVGAFPLD